MQINRRQEPSGAAQRGQIDGRLLCGVGISAGFEVSPAAQPKGGELTFGPGGKLHSPVNGRQPDFPLARPRPLCVCPAASTVDPGLWWKSSRRLRRHFSYLQPGDGLSDSLSSLELHSAFFREEFCTFGICGPRTIPDGTKLRSAAGREEFTPASRAAVEAVLF